MSVHEQFAEDLALHALSTLEGNERAALEQHLSSCGDCRQELEQLRGDMSLLALSTVGPKPPARSRQRLLDAVARESRHSSSRTSSPWWSAARWLAAAALLTLVALLLQQNTRLRQRVASLQNQSGDQVAELEQAKEIVQTLTATDALRVTLVAAKTPPQPQGKAIYARNRSSLIFLASNFRPLPADKIYELWLVPTKGAPIAAGLFKPDSSGSAAVINPPLPAGVEAKAFIVTLEPESGSHEAPRGAAVMSGAGE